MLSPASRFARLHYRLAEHLRRKAESSIATVAGNITEPAKPINPPGIGHIYRRPVNCSSTVRWPVSWQRNCSWSGRRGRSLGGWSAPTRTLRTSRCHTRLSIARSVDLHAALAHFLQPGNDPHQAMRIAVFSNV